MFAFLEFLLKIVGLAKVAIAWSNRHHQKKIQQQIADAPATDEEWTAAGKRGDL